MNKEIKMGEEIVRSSQTFLAKRQIINESDGFNLTSRSEIDTEIIKRVNNIFMEWLSSFTSTPCGCAPLLVSIETSFYDNGENFKMEIGYELFHSELPSHNFSLVPPHPRIVDG